VPCPRYIIALSISQRHLGFWFYNPTELDKVNMKHKLFVWIASCCLHEIVKDSPCNKCFLLDLQIVRYPKEWRKDLAVSEI
jgi:hypothetical protein